MMDSIPVVFITAQVNSKLIGLDAFQETDVTGITLPITKHNYLVTDVKDIGHTCAKPFTLPVPAVPALFWWISPRMPNRMSTEWDPRQRTHQPAWIPPECQAC